MTIKASKRRLVTIGVIGLLSLLLSACSIRRMAMNMVADSLTGGGSGNVFTSDNDPELVGDALPFAIKMYESLMASIPGHSGLQVQTGSMYIMYANAFLQTPASMLTNAELNRKEALLARARNLYLRGRDILLEDLERKYPGFRADLARKPHSHAVKPCASRDVASLYWAAAGWVAAYAIDPFDMKLGLTVPQAEALMQRVLELEPGFGNGSIHDFYILYYGSLPEYMGGSSDKAREHFQHSVSVSKGLSTSPYLSLATTVCIKQQRLDEFRELLGKALAVDPEKNPGNRLVTILNQRRARWLLKNQEDFFLEASSDLDTSDSPSDSSQVSQENQP